MNLTFTIGLLALSGALVCTWFCVKTFGIPLWDLYRQETARAQLISAWNRQYHATRYDNQVPGRAQRVAAERFVKAMHLALDRSRPDRASVLPAIELATAPLYLGEPLHPDNVNRAARILEAALGVSEQNLDALAEQVTADLRSVRRRRDAKLVEQVRRRAADSSDGLLTDDFTRALAVIANVFEVTRSGMSGQLDDASEEATALACGRIRRIADQFGQDDKDQTQALRNYAHQWAADPLDCRDVPSASKSVLPRIGLRRLMGDLIRNDHGDLKDR